MADFFSKAFTPEADISARKIVKAGSTAGGIVVAAASGDKLLGVLTEIDASNGYRADVIHAGPAYVIAGAAISAGDRLTADSSGRAITAAPSAGVNAYTIGTALEAASAAGDIILAYTTLGVLQG